jgi:hypothetical protein
MVVGRVSSPPPAASRSALATRDAAAFADTWFSPIAAYRASRSA